MPLLVNTSPVHLLLNLQDMFICMTKHDLPGGILLASGHQQNSVYPQEAEEKQRSVIGKRMTAPKAFPRVALDLATTVERIQQNFVICDPNLPDCPIVFASDGFIELTEYPRHEILGRNCRYVVQPCRKAIGRLHADVSCAQNHVQGCYTVLAFARPSPTEQEHCVHASSKVEQARSATGMPGCMVRILHCVVLCGICDHKYTLTLCCVRQVPPRQGHR